MEEKIMSEVLDLQKTSNDILSQDATQDYTDEEILELETMVEKLASQFTWPKVYEIWG